MHSGSALQAMELSAWRISQARLHELFDGFHWQVLSDVHIALVVYVSQRGLQFCVATFQLHCCELKHRASLESCEQASSTDL